MKVLAIVLAGGQGARLHPISAVRSKPAVPLGSRYRIVDFVLSNLANSGVHAIYLLVQYKSQSLIEHVSKAWAFSRTFPGEFVSVVPPQMMDGKQWFQGTADAVFQNLGLIERHAPEMVAVLGADHIYRMDFSQMVDYHRDSRIGFDPVADSERYSLSPGGIVVVPRGPDIPDLTRYEG